MANFGSTPTTKEHGIILILTALVSGTSKLMIQKTSIFIPCFIVLGTWMEEDTKGYEGEFRYGMKDGKVTYSE